MATEEERAAAYRAQKAARLASRASRLTALSGDTAAAQTVRDGWQPFRLALLEARQPAVDITVDYPEDRDPPPPLWLGRVPSDIELPEYLKRARPSGRLPGPSS